MITRLTIVELLSNASDHLGPKEPMSRLFTGCILLGRGAGVLRR